MATDSEMLERLKEHVRRLVEQRDKLNDDIDQAEKILQDLGVHLATGSKRLARAMTPERMTVAHATRYLRASKNTVKAWIAADAIPSHVDADGRRYLVKSEIDTWLAEGRRCRSGRAS